MADASQFVSLYNALVAQQVRRPKPIRDLPPEERAEYQRAAMRRSRAKAKAALEKGDPEPTAAMVRDALADAALIILASGAPGSAQVRHLLHKAFAKKVGVVGAVEAKARTGRLRPKILTPERLSAKP